MRKLRTNKSIFLILLVAFPTSIIFSNLLVNISAWKGVPYPHGDNKWHWGVQEDDKLLFETEIIMTNLSSPTPEKIMVARYLEILNITSIDNRTQDFMGTDLFSEINITKLFYDPEVDELKLYYNMDPTPIAIFCYNGSHLFKERYFSQSMIPFILPINGTWDNEVEILDDILNDTMYTWFYYMGQMNPFYTHGADSGSNTMWFENSVEGYFLNFTFGTDGIMTHCNASFLYIDYYTGDHWLYQLNFERVFDYDITDEISWGVNVGDTFYFDQSSEIMSIPYQDIKMVVSGFNESEYEVPHMGAYMNMTFQNVLANISIWDGTQYVLTYINHTVGSANNFYPINIYGTQDIFFSVIPTSYTLYDINFFMDYMVVNNPGYPFDERSIYEKDGYLWIELNVSTTNDFVQTNYNSTNGVLESWLQIVSGVVHVASFRKDIPQPWLWSVDIGDVMYVKRNNIMYGEHQDIRARIQSFSGIFMNMTEMVQYGIPLQPGDPEFQFFYFVIAYLDEWNEKSGTWIIAGMPDVFAAANDLWPMFPTLFPTYLIPLGTTGYDCYRLANLLTNAYDDITPSNDAIIFTNTTAGKSFEIYLDGAKGTVTYTGGWLGSYYGWLHMAGYIKTNTTLISGIPYILQSNFITDITMTIQATTIGPGVEYLYALLSQNPVNVSLPIGTPLYYIDQLIINDDLIDGNLTMTITFPSSVNLSLVVLHMYGYNMSGTNEWDEAPSEYYDNIIYSYLTNSILIETPPWGSYSIISAMSYESILPPGDFNLDSNAGSPDDDGDFTLTWDASDGAESYSVYRYSSYITEINGSLTRIATDITSLSLALTGYGNGTYYFIIVAHNEAGDTLSNCLEVVVEIPPEGGGGDGDGGEDGGGGGIPGYPLFILLTFFVLITALVIKKKRKKIL